MQLSVPSFQAAGALLYNVSYRPAVGEGTSAGTYGVHFMSDCDLPNSNTCYVLRSNATSGLDFLSLAVVLHVRGHESKTV